MPGDDRDDLRRLLREAHEQLLERDREIDSLGERLAARVEGMRVLRRQLRKGEQELERLQLRLREAELAQERIESSPAWPVLRLLVRAGRRG